MINSKKKGFTIVELVIVIAVIAVLSAVLIPTFSNLVKKANMSADQQAVRQMNTALAMYEAENGKAEYLGIVKEALDSQGINAYDPNVATPVSKGYVFCWNPEDGKIYIVEANKKPDNYKLLTDNEIKASDNATTALEAGGTVTLLENIVLDQGNVDLSKDLTIIGQGENPIEIKSTDENALRLFNIISSDVELTLENVKIVLDNGQDANAENGTARAISTTGGEDQPALKNVVINLINVTIESCGYGLNLTGGVDGAKVNIKNSTITAFQPINVYADNTQISIDSCAINGVYTNGEYNGGCIAMYPEAQNTYITVNNTTFTGTNTSECKILVFCIWSGSNCGYNATNSTYNGEAYDSSKHIN